MTSSIENLCSLYLEAHKHSAYQSIPDTLARAILREKPGFLISDTVAGKWEEERLEYILKHIDIHNMNIVDIGGNTGYFSIRLAELGARQVTCIEGNGTHAKFVQMAVDLLKISDRVKIVNKYCVLGNDMLDRSDVILFLNVLHHLGDDYGNAEDLEDGRVKMLKFLNDLSCKTRWCAFQMGFNWKGDVKFPVFLGGTKVEVIDFIKNGTKGYWEISSVGIAEKDSNGTVRYKEAADYNLLRDDSLGEFLNRPIFILRSVNKRP